MANITKVPNGPLIKKKGPFKGSTLKSGGKVKKAQGGAAMTKRDSTMADIKEQTRLRQNLTDFRKKVGSKPLTPELIREKDSLKGLLSNYSTKKRVKGTGLSAEQLAKNDQKLKEKMARKDDVVDEGSIKNNPNKKTKSTTVSGSGILGKLNPFKPGCIYTTEDKSGVKKRNGGPVKKAKSGAMIKRADGSMSRRGLWDNLRANKGSGKKPTAAMLKQEKKIKAKTKK
jgi:hypothetical protein